MENYSPIFADDKTRTVDIVDPVEHIEWHFSIGEGADKTAILAHYDGRHDTVLYPTTYGTTPDGTSNRRMLARPLKPEGPGYRNEELTSTYVNGVWCEGDRYVQLVAPGMQNNKSDHNELVITETWFFRGFGRRGAVEDG